MARPEMISERHVRDAEEAMRLGMTNELASSYIGISEATFYQWLSNARDGRGGLYKRFSEAVSRGRSKCAALSLARIHKGAQEDWRAAAWIMERRFGYHRKSESVVEVGPTTGEADPEELIARILKAVPVAEELRGQLVHEYEEE